MRLVGQADAGAAQMDLVLELLESADEVTGDLEYSTDLFERSTMKRMSVHLQVGALSVNVHVLVKLSADAGLSMCCCRCC